MSQLVVKEDGSGFVPVHLEVQGRIACEPLLKIPRWPWMRTNDWRVVSCPLCRLTAVYEAARNARGRLVT